MPRRVQKRSKEPQKNDNDQEKNQTSQLSVSKSVSPQKKSSEPEIHKDKPPAPTRETRSMSRAILSKSRISKSVTTKNKSNDSENESVDEVNDTKAVVFKKDTYVAFIDREAVLVGAEIFSIGRVVNDVLNENKDINVFQFQQNQKQTLKFTQHSEEPLLIKDYQVICSVKLVSPQGASKTLSISKKQCLEVAKLMKNIFEGVREKINDEEDQEAEQSSSDKQYDSDEYKIEPSDGVQRTFLRGKRNLHALTQESKVLSQVIKPKKATKVDDKNEQMQEDEDYQPNYKKKKTISNQIGKKRPFPVELENQSLSQPSRKVRKLANGQTESVEVPQPVKAKKKPATKKPLQFKLGKWNPDTILLEQKEELERFGISDALITTCCLRCNCRNMIRAVDTENLTLLRSAINAKDLIPTVNQRWSIDTPDLSALDMVFKKQNIQMLETFIDIPCNKTAGQYEYQQAANQFYNYERVKVKKPLLTRVDTGNVSLRAYGAEVRQVQQTRGNRQGNQAFVLEDIDLKNPQQIHDTSENFKKFITVDLFKAWSIWTRASKSPVEDFAQYALAGNLGMMIWILEENIKHENYGFNKLHLDVLTLQILTEKYHTASITKKAANCNITPLHLACLNPNQNVLKALLDQNNDFTVQDAHNNKPTHYAAMCSSTGPLLLLLERGATVFDLNGQMKSPLHFAAQHARPENVQVILQNNVLSFKLRDKTNKTAFTYALENGDIETIKAFLDSSQRKIKINSGQGIDRMTPLMYAAAAGKYELAEFLLERKARVLSKDKFKRTALIMAVRNGHTRLASLLLQHGSDMKHEDSSSNTPLHYAAGSGFIECIDLLLKHGTDLNSMNSWKVTPITIAMLNNHNGTVKRLLQEQNVDVNGKDDSGRTLLLMALLDLRDQTCVDFVKFLLDKGADPNMGDLNKVTPLQMALQHLGNQNCVEIVKLLLDKGADPNMGDHNKFAPLQMALSHLGNQNCLEIVKSLLDKGADPNMGDLYKLTPLQMALSNLGNQNCDEIVKLLLDKGADPNLGNVKKVTPLHILAAYKQHPELLQNMIDLLLSRGANMSLKSDSNQTPFEVALQCDNIYVLKKFIKSVKLVEDPIILHKFESKLFDERFREILLDLINQEPNLSPRTVNYPDQDGFSPFLAYVKSFVEKKARNQFSSQIRTCLLWNAQKHKQNYDSYEITNRGLYEQLYTQQLQYGIARDYQNIPEEKLLELTKKYTYELFTQPFIEFLTWFIEKGADPHMKVGKLQYYRELDEKNLNFLTVNQAGDALVNAQQMQLMQIDTSAQNQGFLKIREQPIEEFQTNQYNQEFGLQNAIHLLFRNPSNALYEFLVEKLGIAIDETDILGRNPFLMNTLLFSTRTTFFPQMEKLLQRNVRFDLPDKNGRTPFLIFYEKYNMNLADQLITKGANINQMDNGGQFALKYAFNRRNEPEVARLVNLGADINQVDNKGRNLLHYSVNMSSATADATFETEQMLIDLGININQRDEKGRVPLHYAFVKIKNWNNYSQIDPIETVSSLCGRPGLEIEVADKWHKTPLHYAAQRGATICTLYILQRGANLESKDIYGNSVLGISILRKHFNYTILLIQKQANVCLPVYEEYPEQIAQMWKNQAEEQKRQLQQKQTNVQDVEMQESESEVKIDKTGRDLFKKKKLQIHIFSKGRQESSSDTSEDQYVEEDEDNSCSQSEKLSDSIQSLQHQNQNQQQQQLSVVQSNRPSKSAFRHAIQNQLQGLAYLILDNNYDYMLAMQDALDDKKFNLVLTLLSKTADNRIVQQKNDLNQNLMHILAKNSNGGQMHILRRIYNSLRSRGVNCLEQDSLGNNALHYAIQQNCYDLCEILISEGIEINSVNNEGHTPLSLVMRGERAATQILRPYNANDPNYKTLFILLAKNGADMNFCYPEDSYPEEKNYKCSIMINIVRKNKFEIEQLRANLICLFEYGANLKTVDSHGRDVLMYSIMQNHNELVQFFINNAERGLLKNHKDNEGKNAIFYVVNPIAYGSFENVDILNMIINPGFGYDLAATDKYGKTPLDYAKLQKSGVLSSIILKKLGLDYDLNLEPNYLPNSDWPPQLFEFEKDANELLEQAEAKKVKELMEEKKDSYVPIEKAFRGEKQYSVYFEGQGADRRPYDAYMTKVDLQNGFYGDYKFYKMQMVYDSNRELFIVLTRYGRIGEEGMHQRSPFTTAEEATQEFKTIFKQKSGNEWENTHNAFIKHPKKYVLVNIKYTNVYHKDYLAPFDYRNCAQTQMERSIRLLLEEISNVTMFQRSLQSMGIDQSQLPVSKIKKETIKEATQILDELSEVIQEISRLRSSIIAEFNYEKQDEMNTKLSGLTSKFYQMIPMAETDYWSAKPINDDNQVKTLREKLDSLTNIEFSSRILLGALHRQMIINPVDYVLDCIQTQFRQLQPEELEFALINQYIRNTSGNNNFYSSNFKIFKIQKRGEGERFEKYESFENRRLLFHGSAMTNMLGIMTQGLRIAPPEAPTTGYMFGKGLYFADLFKKSANYSHIGHNTRLMLLCEVALGNMMERYTDWWDLKLPPQYDSVKAVGQYGGNFKKRSIVTPEGFKVPDGPEAISEKPDEEQFMKTISQNPEDKRTWENYCYKNWLGQVQSFNWPLQSNEYIVYNVDQVKMRYMIQW